MTKSKIKHEDQSKIEQSIREGMKQIVEAGGDGSADLTFNLAGIPWIVTIRVDVEKLLIERNKDDE